MFGHVPARKVFVISSVVAVSLIEIGSLYTPVAYWAYLIVGPLVLLGIRDMGQKKHAIKRNFPIIGNIRYLFEFIRPEINQYFVESNLDGRPFNRETRANIYQRAKRDLNTHPFGTQENVYDIGYEWINHSISPLTPLKEEPRILVGGNECTRPYLASIFNISAMSYGALSKNAVLALNKGAQLGGFAHNTGEGGLTPFHLENGGDIIWQIGTGYFGCRTQDGHFSALKFSEKAAIDNVKMIEIKLSQGAKPGHGGILPAAKVTPEIAQIRGVMVGQDVISPPAHTAFSTPKGLLEFVAKLRELSGGKPVGFKLCIGHRVEFLGICKAMLATGILPDFITVDGGEGGTGAAPLEFSDSVGTPLNDALVFVHNALVGCGLREKIRIIASGKITTGFNLITKIAMGADMCNSARGMMFALGCIQALQCHANTCPTGVATQNPALIKGLDVQDKSVRVANFHDATVESFLEILGATGLSNPTQLKPHFIYRRVSLTQVKTLNQIYDYIEPGALLSKPYPLIFESDWEQAHPDYFINTAFSNVS